MCGTRNQISDTFTHSVIISNFLVLCDPIQQTPSQSLLIHVIRVHLLYTRINVIKCINIQVHLPSTISFIKEFTAPLPPLLAIAARSPSETTMCDSNAWNITIKSHNKRINYDLSERCSLFHLNCLYYIILQLKYDLFCYKNCGEPKERKFNVSVARIFVRIQCTADSLDDEFANKFSL